MKNNGKLTLTRERVMLLNGVQELDTVQMTAIVGGGWVGKVSDWISNVSKAVSEAVSGAIPSSFTKDVASAALSVSAQSTAIVSSHQSSVPTSGGVCYLSKQNTCVGITM